MSTDPEAERNEHTTDVEPQETSEQDPIVETAEAVRATVNTAEDEKAKLAAAEKRRRDECRRTMEDLDKAREKLGPFCISVGIDEPDTTWSPRKRFILLTEPTEVAEDFPDGQDKYLLWTIVCEDGFFQLKFASEHPAGPLKDFEQKNLDEMREYIKHAVQQDKGVVSMGGKHPEYFMLMRYQWANDRGPRANTVREQFVLGHRRVVEDVDKETVMAAVQFNMDKAAEPLIAARDAADAASNTAESVQAEIQTRLLTLTGGTPTE